MKPEKRVKLAIKQRVARTHPEAWQYMPVQMGYGQAGIPDHIMCIPTVITEDMVGQTIGRFVAVEAKAPSGKLTPNQEIQIAAIRAASGVVKVVYGADEARELVV